MPILLFPILLLASTPIQKFPVESWGLAPHYQRWEARLKSGDPYAMMEVYEEENLIGCSATKIQISFRALAAPLLKSDVENNVPKALYYWSKIAPWYEVEGDHVKPRNAQPGAEDLELKYLIKAAELGEPHALRFLSGYSTYNHNDNTVQEDLHRKERAAFQKLAEQGDSEGMLWAHHYNRFRSEKEKTHPREGGSWLQKAISKNSYEARRILFSPWNSDQLGKTTPKRGQELALAIHGLSKLVDEGYYWAAADLMDFYYYKGKKSSPDYQKKARYWAKRGMATLGDCVAWQIDNILNPEGTY